MDRYSNRAYLSIQGSVAWVNRRLLTATGCSAHPLPDFRAGTDDKLAASGQAGEGRHEPTRRRTRTSGGGSGYQLRRWSNSKAGADYADGPSAGIDCPVWSSDR